MLTESLLDSFTPFKFSTFSPTYGFFWHSFRQNKTNWHATTECTSKPFILHMDLSEGLQVQEAEGCFVPCSSPPPSFDKTRKVFVLNRVLHVSDVLRDGRTAKIHPVLSAKVTGIKFLMSNIISIQSSYFSIYVTPLFFLPLESVQSCS